MIDITALLPSVSEENAKIVQTFIALKQGTPGSFNEMSEALFEWAKGLL